LGPDVAVQAQHEGGKEQAERYMSTVGVRLEARSVHEQQRQHEQGRVEHYQQLKAAGEMHDVVDDRAQPAVSNEGPSCLREGE